MKKIVPFLLFLFFICSCSSGGSSSGDLILVAESEGGRLYKAGPVSVLQLHGTHYQMGRQYGILLKDDLSVLYNSMIITFSPYWTYERMKQIAEAVYAVYPQKYKDILIGMAETSGLGIEKQIILNAIEFIPKINNDVPHCSGLAVWGDYTAGGPLIFGRNNDDAEKYKIFGKYTLVAVFNPTDSGIPTAIVNYAGAIYAPNGMNRNGIFLELNGGNTQTNYLDRPSIFVTLFSFLQSCATQDEMNTAFQSVLANMSSIVNVADGHIAYSFECPVTGVKRRNPDDAGLMASTNHFIDPSWGIAPPGPTEDSAVRRNNLLALANANKGYLNVEKMKQILGKSIGEGGATNDGTIFQIIAVPSDLTMWLKAPGNFDWQRVDLDKLFIW
jgi:hypothetical protein